MTKFTTHFLLPLAGLMLIAASTSSASAAVIGPYTADANTLHLWHLDETGSGPITPASGVTGSFNLSLTGGATLGASAYYGFGTAGNTNASVDSGFVSSSEPVSSLTGANGEFTFEAIVNTSEITTSQMILSLERSGGASGRPFQFRINNGVLLFINISDGVQQISTPIPTTGDNAFVANEWFHAAVTYDGNENTADNLKLYWTRLENSNEFANEILSTTMNGDLGGSSSLFGIGNEYREDATANILGLIDEVRVSGIARSAGDFLFTENPPVPEPSSLTLWMLLGLCGRVLVRRQRS